MGTGAGRDSEGDQGMADLVLSDQQWRGAPFRKSSHSDPDNCVFAALPGAGPVAIRDGKIPHGPMITAGRAPWTTFVTWISQS
ncbi:DUF397 domain-containing protein [Streptomyces sioyaensis]|uniref:DUF397 domain-containing protein n=1 Tax=Streptomyces sioyaensis TaxID=67364 RepID=UPI00365A925D